MHRDSKQAWIWTTEQSQRAVGRQRDGEEPERQISTEDGIIRCAAKQGTDIMLRKSVQCYLKEYLLPIKLYKIKFISCSKGSWLYCIFLLIDTIKTLTCFFRALPFSPVTANPWENPWLSSCQEEEIHSCPLGLPPPLNPSTPWMNGGGRVPAVCPALTGAGIWQHSQQAGSYETGRLGCKSESQAHGKHGKIQRIQRC